MSLLSLKALILRANPATEHDRYVKLLSSEQGLTEVYARGALRQKSPLLATTEAFSLCEFTLFTNKEKYYVNQANFTYPFSKLKQSIEALTAAAHLADIAIDIAQTVESADELYKLMIYAFYALEQAVDRGVEAILAVTHATEIRLLALAGYRLDFSPCPHCRLPLREIRDLYFSFPRMSFLCGLEGRKLSSNVEYRNHLNWEQASNTYLGQAIWPISQALYGALLYFADAPLQRLFAFNISKEVEKELSAFTQAYLTACLEKNYRRLGYLLQLSGVIPT